MRRLILFPCAGDTLAGTLDEADGATGLLIVSGGNEIRVGAHRGMAELAAGLAAEGVPVFRFDRRGIGDSSGKNTGYAASAPDIAAAAATFVAEARVTRLVAFGNCDAATALALYHSAAGTDALVLANPWTGDAEDGLPPAAAIRARYAEKIRDPRAWLRLARGGVDFGKIAKGLHKVATRPSQSENPLTRALAAGLAGTRATILLAERDNTAIAFRQAWRQVSAPPPVTILSLDSASHSFATATDKAWLRDQVMRAIQRESAA
ncbi:hydrolase 1, exosortase A system-associated [Sphingomonas sp.]|uniref:hydrolase 1, exosortase A system-associated n=1 Tax=Sphingomonas sp. TaxID=28214 RepID=UPI002C319561|nr:hydrolase 1, exosortase A system-associated [Sphingomonas sp.]HWK36513.1 hydrolase 1, exosortase A system-associated [Sphingomonas sp.]